MILTDFARLVGRAPAAHRRRAGARAAGAGNRAAAPAPGDALRRAGRRQARAAAARVRRRRAGRRRSGSASTIAAAAVEMIHAYSLVHDDLPCMDDDVLRRGKPTCHVEFDEATALLAGDALQSAGVPAARASIALARRCRRRSSRWCSCWPRRAGSRGMAGGQAIDLDGVGKALTAARARIHAHPQDRRADPRRGRCWARAAAAALDRDGARRSSTAIAKCVGLAFQVVDDMLDVEGVHRDARQDRGQGRRAGQADLRQRCWASPRAQRARRGAAARRARGARRLRRARAAPARSSPTSSYCGNSSMADSAIPTSAHIRRCTTAEDHQRPRRAAPARPRSSCTQLAGELRAFLLESVSPDRRPPVVEPRHGRAHHRAALRVRHAARPHRLGRRATRPTRTRSSPAGASGMARLRMMGGISGFPRRERERVRHVRHRAFVAPRSRRRSAWRWRRKLQGREPPRGRGDRRRRDDAPAWRSRR